jgi:hypothetical protein
VLETTPPPTEAPIVVGISHSFATRDDERGAVFWRSGGRQLQCGDLYDGGHLERAFTTSLIYYLRQLLRKEIDLYEIYVVEGKTNFPMS